MPNARPYLSAAFVCERVLEDKDGSISAIRIVDTFHVDLPKDMPPDVIPALELTLVVSFKKASSNPTPESHEVSVRLHAPSGAEFHSVSAAKLPFVLAEMGSGHNLIMRIRLPVGEFGLFWFDVNLDDELVTRIPVKLLKQEAPQNSTR